MEVPYWMDGKAQMKKVKEEKERSDIANTSLWGKKRKKYTQFTCKLCGNKSNSYLKEVIQEGLCLKCRTIKEKERITMPKGKFLCGLNGCTKMVSSAHQAKHALEGHDMDIRAYKDARLDMKKGKHGMVMATGPAAKEPPTPAPSNTEEINKKSDEEFKPSLDEKMAKAKMDRFDALPNGAYTEQQHKTPGSMPEQEDCIEECYDGASPELFPPNPVIGSQKKNTEPMITEESLKIVKEKEQAENKLKEIQHPKEEYSGTMRVSMSPEEEQNMQKEFTKTIDAAIKASSPPKYILSKEEQVTIIDYISNLIRSQKKTREIVVTKTYACPHCGGALKSDE